MSADLTINHIEFHVGDAGAAADRLVDAYGFTRTAATGPDADDAVSVAVCQGDVHLVLTEPRAAGHDGHAFLECHGDGVADVALRTPDVRGAVERALIGGARPAGPDAVYGYGDLRHTFVEDRGPDTVVLPGLGTVPATGPESPVGLRAVDHLALCLAPGEVDRAVDFYGATVGLKPIFEERIEVGTQAMLSRVVQSASGAVTLTLIEPDVRAEPGQIDAFLRGHGGPGVQHVAYRCDDAVATVRELTDRGVAFLEVPDSYYRLLDRYLSPRAHRTEELRSLRILVDEDHDGQLFQLFTSSTHERGTYFDEIIERHGATTFGSGNIRALYEAVAAEQAQTGEPG